MRTGLNRWTGMVLTGWDHCAQSLGYILSTRVAEVVMLRQFGSEGLDLQDLRATPLRIMQVYVGVAKAIRLWEPGFRLQTVQLVRYGADGVFAFEIGGIFYPLGHLGDYGVSEARSVVLASNDNGFAFARAA